MPHELEQELVSAWRANEAMNALVLDALDEEQLACTLSKRGGRGVLGELAHIHTNRVWQIEKRAPDLAKGLKTYAAKDEPSVSELKKQFEASGRAVESLLVGQLNGAPKRRGFKKGVFTTLAYFVAHESHHRGRILLTLKASGRTLDKDAAMGLWGWDRV